jgi:two-component system phosphate regulon response regulator PhoB
MSKPRILIIEDERAMALGLSFNFEKEGYEAHVAHDGPEGLRKAQTLVPDVILLDIMLPGMNGIEVCRELRSGERTRDIPIIMITAKTEESDELIGFSHGADDYVHKPFSIKVLIQRVRALKRRTESSSDPTNVIEHFGIRVDKVKHRVTLDNQELTLTPTEFRLLECLLRQPGRAFSRHHLMDSAIGQGSIVLERTIDVHVKTLRRKLMDRGDLIETVRGVGYRFRDSRESSD